MDWPVGLTPEQVPMYAHNEIVIRAKPEQIWWWLCHAKKWPEWYSNCAWMRITAEELTPGTEFTWKTFGVVIQSTVIVYKPYASLEWNAKCFGLRAYHGWRIEQDGEYSRVVTEETQAGILPLLEHWFLPKLLWNGHQIWVESLKKMAESTE